MKIYDKLEVNWSPYLMFKQNKDIKSLCLNTDEYGLRFTDEFVRHKILDTIGDLSLLGHEIAGKITTYKSGHNLHNLLCKKLLDTPSAYEIVSASSLKREAIKAFELPRSIIPAFH